VMLTRIHDIGCVVLFIGEVHWCTNCKDILVQRCTSPMNKTMQGYQVFFSDKQYRYRQIYTPVDTAEKVPEQSPSKSSTLSRESIVSSRLCLICSFGRHSGFLLRL